MKLKSLILRLLTLLCLQTTPNTQSYPADIETIFLPQSQAEVYARLSSFLDRAKNRVLIAMYWFTDEQIFNKLAELAKRGIQVQIIFDESTPDAINHLIAFSRHNIIAMVSPKGTNGIMHNKFVVIDDSMVWTGSANFTQTVLAPQASFYNDENIVIIISPIAAEQYSNTFYFIEKTIIQFYLQTMAHLDGKDLPNWMIPLCQWHYQVNRYFTETLTKQLPQFTIEHQAKLCSIFHLPQPLLPEQQPFSYPQKMPWEEEPTPKQKAYLESKGFPTNISKRLETELIGKIMRGDIQ